MVQFQIFGIRITVLPWFWLTMAILGAGNLSSGQDLFRLFLFILAGFISILVHELGHALMIKKFRLPTEIVLQAFGGYATYPKNRLSRPQDFLVTAAGPAIQIFLGFLALALLNSGKLPSDMSLYFFKSLMLVSFMWAILNCFPIFPLDGGQMLNAILGPKRKKITHLVGMIVAVLLGVYALMVGQIFLAIFTASFAYLNYQNLKGIPTDRLG